MYIGLMYKFHPMITFVPTISKKVLPHVPFVTRYESAFVGADPAKTSLVSRAFRKIVVQWAGGADVAYSSGTLLRDSDQVIVLCERHRAMLIEEWPKVSGKTVLIPPPPNIRICTDGEMAARNDGRDKLGVDRSDFLIAFLGYIYPIKGVETLLHAFQMVSRQRSNVRLLFIGGKCDLDVEGGSSYMEQIQDLARRLGVADKTTWTGAFKSEDEEASRYLQAADACVLPFLEGVQLNNSSFSSMATHGLPIITTQGPVLDKQFIHNENVLLCPPRDHEALAKAIMLLMDNPELCKRLRIGARKLAQEWFSWEKAIDRTLMTLDIRLPQQTFLEANSSWLAPSG